MKLLPVSMVIATMDRPAILARTINGFLEDEGGVPREIIIADASPDPRPTQAIQSTVPDEVEFTILRTEATGAASQRNEGTAIAREDVIFYADDDIIPEPGCLDFLFTALEADPELGGVNAMITNQQYEAPGRVSRFLWNWYTKGDDPPSGGRCIGPARNLLPSNDSSLPEVVPVEWINTGCTLYRKEALPEGPFDSFFVRASICEDLALSLRVAQNWKLANIRTARIFHDSQPGRHKSSPTGTIAMGLRNRHYIMTQLLGRNRPSDLVQLLADGLHGLLGNLRSTEGFRTLPDRVLGITTGFRQIFSDRKKHAR